MKFPPYETYLQSKLSWLDEIPNGWDVIPIKFGLEIPITDGPHETPEIFNEGIPFLSAESVKKDKLDFSRKRGFISIEEHKRFSMKYKPKRGDVYMVKSGATTGNMARVETDEEFNIWSPLAAMRPDTKMLTTDFLFFFMKSKPFFHSVELNWNYGTQQNIGMGVIANLQMALPPVAIQKKIASFLEHKTQQINRLIKKKKALIKKLEEQRIAVITQAVTKGIDENAKLKPSGVDWLGDVPEHWDVKRLRFSINSNPVKSEVAGYDDDTLVSFVPMDSVSEYGGMNVSQEKPIGEVYSGYTYFQEKDVVIAKITPCFENGKGSLVPALTNDIGFGTTEFHVLRSLCNIHSEYLFFLTISDPFRAIGASEMLGAGGQKRIPENFIKDFRFGLPPIEEQHNIVLFLKEKLAKLDAMKNANFSAIEKLEEYRSAIITSAVTGKIDVRDVEVPKEVM
jgi:type I restriction enzyme S subunit